jgi:hypothetical protein
MEDLGGLRANATDSVCDAWCMRCRCSRSSQATSLRVLHVRPICSKSGTSRKANTERRISDGRSVSDFAMVPSKRTWSLMPQLRKLVFLVGSLIFQTFCLARCGGCVLCQHRIKGWRSYRSTTIHIAIVVTCTGLRGRQAGRQHPKLGTAATDSMTPCLHRGWSEHHPTSSSQSITKSSPQPSILACVIYWDEGLI